MPKLSLFANYPSLESFVYRHKNDEAIIIAYIYPDNGADILHISVDDPNATWFRDNYDLVAQESIAQYTFLLDNQVFWYAGDNIKNDIKAGDYLLPDGKTVGFDSECGGYCFGYELNVSRFANYSELMKLQEAGALSFLCEEQDISTCKDKALQGALKMLNARIKSRAANLNKELTDY